MRYPPSVLDEIRARLPVSAVVAKRVKLKKAGREWKGLSPFNHEKTPSFYVNDQKGFYHCFSSGKHGDQFDFVMETEGLSFPETVERLAAEAGVTLPRMTREEVVREERRQGLHEVLELAAAFFEAELKGPRGAKAREYLARRALAPETQAAFRIGYAPNERFGLRDHLAQKGVSREAMVEAGLLVSGDDIAVPYDRFRDRVMFPICDLRGRVVGFGGRALAADAPAKYLNSPETPLFQKGSLLYNAHAARKAAHERGTVIAVEGYVDVIAMSVSGFPHAVAPLGTALTEEQLGLLWRMADEPILCFDGDKAGRRAAYRAIDVALPELRAGKSLRVALLPEGQDPDDLARSSGPAAIEAVLKGARPLVDVLFARELEAGPLETPEQRAALDRRLMDALASIKDETLRLYYRDAVRERLQALREAWRRDSGSYGGAPRGSFRGGTRPGSPPASPAAGLRASPALARSALFAGAGGASPREAMIVTCLATHPALLDRFADALAELDLAGREADAIRAVLIACAADGEDVSAEIVETRLARRGLSDSAARLRALVRPGDRWVLDPAADVMRLGDALRQAMTLHRRTHTLNSELRAAERALAEDDSEANLAWLRDVQTRLSSVEGAEADMDDVTMSRESGRGQ